MRREWRTEVNFCFVLFFFFQEKKKGNSSCDMRSCQCIGKLFLHFQDHACPLWDCNVTCIISALIYHGDKLLSELHGTTLTKKPKSDGLAQAVKLINHQKIHCRPKRCTAAFPWTPCVDKKGISTQKTFFLQLSFVGPSQRNDCTVFSHFHNWLNRLMELRECNNWNVTYWGSCKTASLGARHIWTFPIYIRLLEGTIMSRLSSDASILSE